MKSKWILIILLTIGAGAAYWFGKPASRTAGLGLESYNLTRDILAIGPRPPGSEGLEEARALLKRELEEAGWTVSFQKFESETPIGRVKFANLRARFSRDGNPWKNKVEGLLCAHLDSKYFEDRKFLGADDAASACAAVVEIAKHLSSNKPEHAEKLELILFDGEEAIAGEMSIINSLYGSRFYANSWRSLPAKPKFGILLDMIGHKNLSIRIPADSPEELAELMFETAKKQGVSRHFGTAQGPILDDHVPLNLAGIPTLDIIGNFQNMPWWHQPADPDAPERPTDDLSIISQESLNISTGVVLQMLDELLKDS